MTGYQLIVRRIDSPEERWVACETVEKQHTRANIPGKSPWTLQTKLPEMMVEHFRIVEMLQGYFKTVTGVSKECRGNMFNNVFQYPKDHQDPRNVLKNLQIKAFKVFTAKSGDKRKVTNRQSVESKKI